MEVYTMLKKGNKADYKTEPLKEELIERPVLEYGKPIEEGVMVMARNGGEAIKKAQAGKGRKFTQEEADSYV